MKKLMSLLLMGALFMVLGCKKDSLFDDPLPPETMDKVTLRDDVTQEQINQAIADGIDWMVLQQNPSGFFSSTSDGVARTALAVAKLCDWSFENGVTPQTGPYATEIGLGLNFILSNAIPHSGGGYILNVGNVYHDVYNTGIGMMALASYGCPDCPTGLSDEDADTYLELLQETVEYFDVIQNTGGGWRYTDGSQPSDNSNTGFATLGLLAAQQAGCTIPDGLKSKLSVFIDFIQNDQGGSGYTSPNDMYVNVMKTGNLLTEMALVGDPPDAPRAQLAVSYIANNWGAPSSAVSPGWSPDNWLAMYCMMKGAVAMGLDDFNGIDWYTDFANAIVLAPHDDGYWNSGLWIDPYLSTVFNLLTLEKFAPQPIIEVGFDIKPTSCPNPVNRDSKGVIPMAILGSDDFDVGDIDRSTINIEGISPVKTGYEDVATPYEPGPDGLVDQMNCTTEGPDGYTDLIMHFKTSEIATLLEGLNKKDVFVLTIQGEMEDGRVFRGEDIIVIVK
jgi:hypothetical protein